MKKTVLTAATATLTAGLIGLAAVASAGGPSSSGTGEVSSTSPAATSQPVRGGADDPVPHDVGDDHGSAGHGADDVPAPTPADVPLPTPVATPAPAAVPAPASGGRHGADDPVSHDVGDDHG